jgi:hypothetical protein
MIIESRTLPAGMKVEPIFVVGTPRSGTTLTARILNHHHRVFAPAPGETHFFHDIWTRGKTLGNLEDEAALSRATDRLLTVFGRRKNYKAQELVCDVVEKKELLSRTNDLGGGYGGLYYAFTFMTSFICSPRPKSLAVHEIRAIFCVHTNIIGEKRMTPRESKHSIIQ